MPAAFLDPRVTTGVAALLAAGEHVLLVGHRGSGKSLVTAAALKLLVDQPDASTYTRIVPVSTVSRCELMNDLTTLERAIVVIDRASLVDDDTLRLLQQAVAEREALLLIEADSRNALPPALREMLRRSRHSTVSVAPLVQDEFHGRLVERLGGPIPTEITGHLWRSCGGNRELLGVLVDALIEREELVLGDYAWTCRVPLDAETADVPYPVVRHVERQFHALNSEQQNYLRRLSLCGSLSTSETVRYISDNNIEALKDAGFVQRTLRPDGTEAMRLRAAIFGWVISRNVAPGARAEIFASLPTPMRDREDPAAILAWTRLALQLGAEPSAELLVLGNEAAFTLHQWSAVEAAVNTVIPANLLGRDLIAHLMSLAPKARESHLVLLLQRGLAAIFQDHHDRARTDCRTVQQTLALDPGALGQQAFRLLMVEVTTYRTLSDSSHLDAAFDRAIAHAIAMGDAMLAEAYRMQRLVKRNDDALSRTPLSAVESLVTAHLGEQPFTVAIVPQTALRIAYAGRFAAAFELITRTLGLRELHITNLPAHALALSYAELVSLGAQTYLLAGEVDRALALSRPALAQTILDSAASELIVAGAHAARGHWSVANDVLRAVLQRLSEADHNRSLPRALALYAQVSAALGDAPRATAAIMHYEQRPLAPNSIYESVTTYQVLVARVALGHDDVLTRIDAYIARFSAAGEWFAVMRAAHLALTAGTASRQAAYLRTLEAAAAHVDDEIASVFLRDAAAIRTNDTAHLTVTRGELAQLGVWIPQRQTEVSLSRRQREIAGLVAGGLPNREIAARLHLSTRTVESHVAMIFAKFDISDRRHLGARLSMLESTP